jgi:hypothetical protein
MKTKQLFWGFFFLTLGMLFLLGGSLSIYLDENFVWDYWPVLLILLGVLIMIRDHIIKTIIIVMIAVGFAALVYGICDGGEKHIEEDFDWDEFDNTPTVIHQRYNSDFEFANLTLSGGWGDITLSEGSDYLWELHSNKTLENISNTTSAEGNKVTSEITWEKRGWKFWKENKNKFNLLLNKNPVWNLVFEIGAANTKLHLEKLKVKNVKIKSGATNIKIYFGKRYPVSKLTLETAASNLEVYLPKESGCRVDMSSLFNMKKLPGFVKDSQGRYINKNFESSENKVLIDLKGAATNFKVFYY